MNLLHNKKTTKAISNTANSSVLIADCVSFEIIDVEIS